MSPALAGGFLTTAPQGKSHLVLLLSRDTEQILPIPIPLAFVPNSDFLNDSSAV